MFLYQQYITCHVLIGESCMELKTEADSNDITEYPHIDSSDKPAVGMLFFSHVYVIQVSQKKMTNNVVLSLVITGTTGCSIKNMCFIFS